MTDDQEARRKLVAYGIQRGRARSLRNVLLDIDRVIDRDEKGGIDHDTLKTWRDQLKGELDLVMDHVRKIEKEAASRRQEP